MQVNDYNGEGRWSRSEILRRYSDYAQQQKIRPRDLSPKELENGGKKWVYPVMHKVIEGIEAGDKACIVLGIEFIEESIRFPFGMILKSNTARALRRAALTGTQQERIRRRILGMLRDGYLPQEYKEYAKLLRRIGIDPNRLKALAPQLNLETARVARFYNYFLAVSQMSTHHASD